jgi:hypothetical protein
MHSYSLAQLTTALATQGCARLSLVHLALHETLSLIDREWLPASPSQQLLMPSLLLHRTPASRRRKCNTAYTLFTPDIGNLHLHLPKSLGFACISLNTVTLYARFTEEN